MSAGMEPSLGFSLLWTTKTANCVFSPSRSCSGNSCTALSTSCWSSEIAYLRKFHQCVTRACCQRPYCRVVLESSISSCGARRNNKYETRLNSEETPIPQSRRASQVESAQRRVHYGNIHSDRRIGHRWGATYSH
jgi:hypothetical protein